MEREEKVKETTDRENEKERWIEKEREGGGAERVREKD